MKRLQQAVSRTTAPASIGEFEAYCAALHSELTAHVFPKRRTHQAIVPCQKFFRQLGGSGHRDSSTCAFSHDKQTLHCHHWMASADGCRQRTCPYAHLPKLKRAIYDRFRDSRRDDYAEAADRATDRSGRRCADDQNDRARRNKRDRSRSRRRSPSRRR